MFLCTSFQELLKCGSFLAKLDSKGRSCALQPLPLWQKAAAGLVAGAVGAVVGSPADLTLVRMQADTTLPEHQQRQYRGIADAFLRISREEGLQGLYRGVGPNIARAMALNMGMLASNDEVCCPCFIALLATECSSPYTRQFLRHSRH